MEDLKIYIWENTPKINKTLCITLICSKNWELLLVVSTILPPSIHLAMSKDIFGYHHLPGGATGL